MPFRDPPLAPAAPRRSRWEQLLDRTILFSFDRTGYQLHRRHYQVSEVEVDLQGRVALVTGASSGIGLAAATSFAQRGAEVWLLCRNEMRGAQAVERICRESASEAVHLALVDVADLASIRQFATGFHAPRVDILVHNAGVLPQQRALTNEGHELTFATHVLGPLALTWELTPRLLTAPDARVLFVSSGGMYTQRLSCDDLDWRQRPYDGVRAYAQTKRMQVVLAEQLAERFARTNVTVNSMHPGWADTSAVRSSLPRFWTLTRRILRSAEQAADTVLWASVCPRLARESGRFWFDRQARPTHVLPWTRESLSERERFWELCREAAGLPEDFTTTNEPGTDLRPGGERPWVDHRDEPPTARS